MYFVKDYQNTVEEGMAFYYWRDEEEVEIDSPKIIEKWPNYTCNNSVPEIVQSNLKTFLAVHTNHGKTLEEIITKIKNIGYYSWQTINGYWYVYGRYHDNEFDLGF